MLMDRGVIVTGTDSAVDRDHLATFHAAYVRVPLGEAAPCEDDRAQRWKSTTRRTRCRRERTPYWQTTQRRCAVARLRTPGRAARQAVACLGRPRQPAGPASGSMQTRLQRGRR